MSCYSVYTEHVLLVFPDFDGAHFGDLLFYRLDDGWCVGLGAVQYAHFEIVRIGNITETNDSVLCSDI